MLDVLAMETKEMLSSRIASSHPDLPQTPSPRQPEEQQRCAASTGLGRREGGTQAFLLQHFLDPQSLRPVQIMLLGSGNSQLKIYIILQDQANPCWKRMKGFKTFTCIFLII